MTKPERQQTQTQCDIDLSVLASTCFDDRCSGSRTSRLTDISHSPLDGLGAEQMTNDATARQTEYAGSEHQDDVSWGEVDPFKQRPRRQKTGGRQKGSLNKKTLQMREAIAALLVPGTDPRTFLAAILKNPEAPLSLRFAAARELMPYMHPKLASIESRVGGRTHEERLEAARNLLDEEAKQPISPNEGDV
jgi:hypothetical protein